MDKSFDYVIYDYSRANDFVRSPNLTPKPIMCYENWLFYVYSGTLHYKEGDDEKELIPGHLYILPAHKYMSLTDSISPFVHLNIPFTSSYIFTKLLDFEIIEDSLPYHLLELMKKFIQRNDPTPLNFLLNGLLSYLSIEGANTNDLVLQVRKYITSSSLNITAQEVCEHFHYSKRHLDNMFVEAFHCTLHAFIKTRKLSYALNSLNAGKSLNEVCNELEYSSPSNLSRDFKRFFGYSPNQLKSSKKSPEEMKKLRQQNDKQQKQTRKLR